MVKIPKVDWSKVRRRKKLPLSLEIDGKKYHFHGYNGYNEYGNVLRVAKGLRRQGKISSYRIIPLKMPLERVKNIGLSHVLAKYTRVFALYVIKTDKWIEMRF